MSEAERIKQELNWLKLMFAALIAIDASLIAWLAQHYEKAAVALLILAVVAIVAVTAGIIAVNHVAYRRMAKLEKL